MKTRLFLLIAFAITATYGFAQTTATQCKKTPELQMNKWVKFEDEDGMIIRLRLVSPKGDPTKMDNIEATLQIKDTDNRLLGYVVKFNKGGLGYYYRIQGLETETGKKDFAFDVPRGGGKGCTESFWHIDQAIETLDKSPEFEKNVEVSFK